MAGSLRVSPPSGKSERGDNQLIILVSGGFGFIGSAVVRRLLATSDHTVVNLDKVTYAATPESLGQWQDHARHVHVRADVCDAEAVRTVFARWRPDRVMHLAAC
jgi:dTDP-glucose 4,6-dehydratase